VIAELAGKDFSTKIHADVPVAAERSMYWGPRWQGGTTSAGAAGPAPVWYFAEGAAAPKFDTYFTILNPGGTVTVDVTFLGEVGQIGPVRSYTIPAQSRATIWATEAVGYAGSVGARIASRGGEGIICERSTYWGNGWVEGSNAVGVTSPAPVWHVPEGITSNGFDTFILMANPNPWTVRVRLWPVHVDGNRRYPVDLDIPANGRQTVWINNDPRFPAEQNAVFSLLVETLTPGPGIIVEHATYWLRDPWNYWRGGSAAFGIPVQ
jgi:hypothetical protein